MDFTKEILANRRALLDDVFWRLDKLIQPFAYDLDCFLATLFQSVLPRDWREQYHQFFRDKVAIDLIVDPASIVELENWIEAWARYCELLPREVEPAQAYADATVQQREQVASVKKSPFMLASVKSAGGKQDTSPPAKRSDPKPQSLQNGEGLEVAGPGPDTTYSYQMKVLAALRFLDENVAKWWYAPSVRGKVCSRSASLFQSNYYSRLEPNEQPVIVVNENFTAGETAQAIIAEVEGGWFADSIGVFYKKYRYARTQNLKEFREWQKGAAKEAAYIASVLAETYLNGISTLTPGGDLVVTLGDIADKGPGWGHLLSALPVIGLLPIGAVIIRAGKRRIKIPKKLARELENASPADRERLLALAAKAKNDDEAADIIQQGAAEILGSEHHIATNKNPVSPLRGGPWTPRFEAIFKKAGLSLDDAENIVRVPGHYGPHPEEYHQIIYKWLLDATEGKSGTQYREAVLDALRMIAVEVRTPGTRLNKLLTK